MSWEPDTTLEEVGGGTSMKATNVGITGSVDTRFMSRVGVKRPELVRGKQEPYDTSEMIKASELQAETEAWANTSNPYSEDPEVQVMKRRMAEGEKLDDIVNEISGWNEMQAILSRQSGPNPLGVNDQYKYTVIYKRLGLRDKVKYSDEYDKKIREAKSSLGVPSGLSPKASFVNSIGSVDLRFVEDLTKNRRTYKEIYPYLKSRSADILKSQFYVGLTPSQADVLQVVSEEGLTDPEQVAVAAGLTLQETNRVVRELASMGRLKVTELGG